jgi:flagellar basal body-associated protein FliL
MELSSVDEIQTITTLTPRINDIIISHLVEITPEEISGSEGIYALKSELLHRINLVISPVILRNLNITSIDVQITDALEKQED